MLLNGHLMLKLKIVDDEDATIFCLSLYLIATNMPMEECL